MTDADLSPTIEKLSHLLRGDPVFTHALQAAAKAAGVDLAGDDMLILADEDVARLEHLDMDLDGLRDACGRLESQVAGLLATWRTDNTYALTPQELLWALTYVLAAQGDGSTGATPTERINSMIASEQWWMRATPTHRANFLERIGEQLTEAGASPAG